MLRFISVIYVVKFIQKVVICVGMRRLEKKFELNSNKIIEEQQKQILEMKEEHNKEILELKETVKSLMINSDKNVVNNNTTNNTNCNNTNNIVNNTININNYGCENKDYITKGLFSKIIESTISSNTKIN